MVFEVLATRKRLLRSGENEITKQYTVLYEIINTKYIEKCFQAIL